MPDKELTEAEIKTHTLELLAVIMVYGIKHDMPVPAMCTIVKCIGNMMVDTYDRLFAEGELHD